LVTLTTALELSCLIIAAICLYQDKDATWRSMIVFLLFTCLIEFTGKIMRQRHQDNNWIYNIYIIAEAGFTGAMYVNLIQQYVRKYKLHVAAFLLLAGLYIYEVYIHGIYQFNNVTTTVMSVVFVFYGLYFYYLLIKAPRHYKLNQHPDFWWVAGSLLFYYVTSVSTLYFAVFNTRVHKVFTYRHYSYMFFNTILYGCWSYSFICRYRQRKLIRS